MSTENWNQNPNDPNAQRPWGSSWDAVGQPGGSGPEQPGGQQPGGSQPGQPERPTGAFGPQLSGSANPPGAPGAQQGTPASQPSAPQPTPPGWENSGWGVPPQGQWQTGWNSSTQYPEQQPPGWQQQAPTGQGFAGGQWAPAPARPPRGTGAFGLFFKALFDFDFRRYVTPQIVKILYILSIIAVGIYWIGSVFVLFGSARSTSVFTGRSSTNGAIVFLAVLDLLFGWIFALAAIALVRMQYEYILALIRTSEYARDIRAHLGAVDSTDHGDDTDAQS